MPPWRYSLSPGYPPENVRYDLGVSFKYGESLLAFIPATTCPRIYGWSDCKYGATHADWVTRYRYSSLGYHYSCRYTYQVFIDFQVISLILCDNDSNIDITFWSQSWQLPVLVSITRAFFSNGQKRPITCFHVVCSALADAKSIDWLGKPESVVPGVWPE